MSDAKLRLAGSEPPPASALLPEGVVTFLLTDIEASTQHWEEHPGLMQVAMETHDEILSMAVEASDGIRPLEQGEGDSAVVAFAEASRALACALDLQRGLAAAEWPDGCELRVRCALHSGEALKRDPRNYVGPALNRCARLRASAFGGQTLISRATHELVIDTLPEDANLRPLGRLRLRGMSRSEEVFELVHPELRSGFPPPPSRLSRVPAPTSSPPSTWAARFPSPMASRGTSSRSMPPSTRASPTAAALAAGRRRTPIRST